MNGSQEDLDFVIQFFVGAKCCVLLEKVANKGYNISVDIDAASLHVTGRPVEDLIVIVIRFLCYDSARVEQSIRARLRP